MGLAGHGLGWTLSGLGKSWTYTVCDGNGLGWAGAGLAMVWDSHCLG